MGRYQTKIGNVVSVSGSSVTIQLSDSVKSNSPIIDGVVYRIGQIGSFLKIPLGYASLFGIVTKIGAAAIPEGAGRAGPGGPGRGWRRKREQPVREQPELSGYLRRYARMVAQADKGAILC